MTGNTEAGGGRIRVLLRQSLLYGLGSAASRSTSVILVPVLTRALSPSDYGRLDLDVSTMFFVAMVLTLGIDVAVWRLFFDLRSERERRDLIVSALVVQAAVCVPVTALLMASTGIWVPTVTGQPGQSTNLRLLLLAVPMSVLTTTFGTMLRARFQVWRFNILALLSFSIIVVSTVVAMTTGHRSVTAAVGSSVVGYAASMVLGTVMLLRHGRGRFSMPLARGLLHFGVALIPAAVALWTLPLSGRFVLAHLLGPTAVAEYGVAAKFAAVPMLAIGAFQSAWGPFALSIMDRGDAARLYGRVFTLMLVAGATFTAVLAVLTPPLIRVALTSAYLPAAPLVAWLTLGTVFTGLHFVTSIGPIIVKRPGLITAALVAGAAVALLGAIVLVRVLGAEGAAVANAAGLGLSAYLPSRLTRRSYPVRYSLTPVLAPVAAAVALAFLGTHLTLPSITADLALRVGFLALYAGVVVHWLQRDGLLGRLRRSPATPLSSEPATVALIDHQVATI
jgi:O-antigen/teichoic acid export membrane protein